MGCCCSNARTQQLATAESRRKHLATFPLIIERKANFPDHIETIREYVDTGKGHMIYTVCFRPKSPDVELKGMICYCQGYSSFTDWTDTDLAIKFVNRGYIFITHDHFGHGRSDGIWLSIPSASYNVWVDDAVHIFERAKRKFTPKAYIKNNNKFHYYLLGHSLGGAVAIEISKRYTSSSYYLNVEDRLNCKAEDDMDNNYESDEKSPLKHNDGLKPIQNTNKNDYLPKSLLESYCCYDIEINSDVKQEILYGWDGLILSSPMVKIKDELMPPAWLVSVGRILVNVFPLARVVPTQSLTDKLTRDKHCYDFLKQSPMYYDDKPALRTAFALFILTQHIESELNKIQIPIFIMHGEKDRITDPALSQLLYDKCASMDKTIKIFKSAWHALLIDTCCNEVMDNIDEWILQRNKTFNKL